MDAHQYHHHHIGVRELDLSACHVNTFADKINHAVPGLKTSTAFFTFLRANLVLSPSAMSSCANTPNLDPITAPSSGIMFNGGGNTAARTGFPPSSPSPLAANPPLVPLDDIPPLSLETLDDPEDKVDGLHLVADSVAEMRQRASRSLVTHPVCLAGYSLGLAAAYNFSRDAGTAITLACGVTMTYLLAIRYFTHGYVKQAEGMGWPWMKNPDGEDDIIIGARFDDKIIGALVLRLEPNPSLAGKRKGRNQTLRGGRGIIRAWTTKLKYRGEGIGNDLLQKAVRTTKEKCGKDAEVGFAKEHANSVMILPSMFNNGFRRDEIRATKALDSAIAEWEVSKRKR